MAGFEGKFARQLSFNFSARRQSEKDQPADSQWAPRSATAIDLDVDTAAHTVSSTNLRDLSRHLVKDMVQTRVGDGFLLCVEKEADFGGKQADIASDQRKLGKADELVRMCAQDLRWSSSDRASAC